MSAESKRNPTVGDVCAAMERIAPTRAAADWDNVGLLVGAGDWPARRVLLTIDMTGAVLDEAVAGRFDVVLAYHPPIFRAVKRMAPDRTNQEGLAAEALSRRVAVYSPHTALDAAPGGTNETLAALAGLRDLTPFTPVPAPQRLCKLVVFVPEAQVERVASAVFDAGGGRIGDYRMCSFRLSGQGTFFGTEAADPAIGRKGRLERVGEIRLEIVFPRDCLPGITAAIRRAHPYEEPAFDVYPLETLPDEGLGQGRIGLFAPSVRLGELGRSLAARIGAAAVTLVGRPSQRVRRGLVCVGAAGSLPLEIPGIDCGPGDVILTGEISHHGALRYQRAGAAAIALGHWASERPALRPLSRRLADLLPGAKIMLSRKDRDPFAGA